MSKNFTVIGGDLRNIKLVNMLSADGNKVYVYGLKKTHEFSKNIVICDNLKEAIDSSEIIIGSIPFSSNGKDINTPFYDDHISIEHFLKQINCNNILVAGSISTEICSLLKEKNIETIDIMKREELAVLNAISTAEGTIEVIIANRDKILHGSKVLILGFGRIAKVLAKKLEGLSADVTCAARKIEDLAWIRTYGYKNTNINMLEQNLAEYDIIINTVPHLILTKERIKYIKNDCLLIDLASKPGGIDQEAVKEKNLKLIWALALPGKVAPVTTAEFIKDTIYNVLKEKNI